MKPTKDQQKAINQIIEWIENPMANDPVYLLTGQAGTGKTFILKNISAVSDKKIAFCATTHKASKVLSDRIGKETSTIHSLLALKPKKIKHQIKLVQDQNRCHENIRKLDAVVLDESSMVDSELLNIIIQVIDKYGLKFLFISDPYQLPPVNEEISPIFDPENGLKSNFELTEIIRQAEGSPIIQMATEMRRRIEGLELKPFKMFSNDVGGVYKLNRKDFIDKLLEQSWIDTNESKILTWTNNTSHNFNKLINKEIFGVTDMFKENQIIQFNEAHIKDDRIIAKNASEWKIKSVKKQKNKGFNFDELVLELYDNDYKFKVVPYQSFNNFRKAKNSILADAKRECTLWRDYYSFIEYFSDIRPWYSVTIHKAQGSTFKNVFVDLVDIQKNSDRQEMKKLIYTAITRASENVYLCCDWV